VYNKTRAAEEESSSSTTCLFALQLATNKAKLKTFEARVQASKLLFSRSL